jgi:hypothetical protein
LSYVSDVIDADADALAEQLKAPAATETLATEDA